MEVFTVSEVIHMNPITCKITDLNGEEIHGSFYEKELQKTTNKVCNIERVIKTRGNKSLVK